MNKTRKARIRALDAKAKARELEQAKQQFQKLSTMVGGFARSSTVRLPKPVPHIRDSDIANARTQATIVKTVNKMQEPKYSPEMQARENKAKAQYELMKMRTAPVANKGGYQYLTDLDIQDLQSGGTRRR